MSWVHYEENTPKKRQPLKNRTGAELSISAIIYSSVVSLDDNSRRLVPKGSVLCKITSGTGINKYGPYDKTASDGRQSVSAATTDFPVVVTAVGVDVTLGDTPVAGWYGMCTFDVSEMTLNGISGHGASLTSLKNAMPHCDFKD